MLEKTYAITGLPRPKDAVTRTDKIPYVSGLPVRYEISAFASSKDPDVRKQWTLFVLALERFKMKPVNEKLSYFQVAGIQCIWENMKDVISHWEHDHNLPKDEANEWYQVADKWRMPYWDWARQQTYAEDFAYPKILVQGPVRIYPPVAVKKNYPPSGLYANPFWGFENPERDDNGDPLPFGMMPTEGGKDYWNIKDDPIEHVINPDDTEENAWIPWSQASGTSRYGLYISKDRKSFRGLDGVNNPWEANKFFGSNDKDEFKINSDDHKSSTMKVNPGTLADQVNRLFAPGYNKDWGSFASTKWRSEGHLPPGHLSLESVHNNVHNITGGSNFKSGIGHMSDVPVAAFDPIFWLHHCQIDRLMAIWQCLNWDLWFKDDAEPKPKAGGPENVPDDTENDPLWPFHDSEGDDPLENVWTAKKCRDWTNLGYHYDDLMKLMESTLNNDKTLNEDKYRTALRNHINLIYPYTGTLVEAITNSPVETPKGLHPGSKKTWEDYVINVVYDRYALKGRSYTIEFFLGGPSGESTTHFEEQNFIGRVYTFAGGKESAKSCDNCKSQAEDNILSCGQVPLTIQLLHHSLDNEADHPLKHFEDAREYLKLHLGWRFVAFGGAHVSPKKFPNTKISVLRGVGKLEKLSTPPANATNMTMSLLSAGFTSSFKAFNEDESDPALTPIYSDYEALPDVTSGKPWGLDDL